MNHEIELAPFLANLFENGLHLTFDAHVKWHQNGCLQLVRERFDMFSCFLVQIRGGDLCTQPAKRLLAAPGDRLIIGNTNNETLLAFEQLCFEGWYPSTTV